ncbi:MAG TPA: hypothetical protein VJX16_10870 [Terriglobales bacterium]|nr:hypothetical protein [Terriglobales bacterium]
MSKRAPLALVLFVVVSSTVLVAQSTQGAKPAAQGDKGFTSYAEFGGTSNVDGQVYRLESSVGYNFNQHFGVDVGVPIYFVRPSTTTGGTPTNGLGNPWLDLRVKFLNPVVNYGSALTGFAPTGDSKRGLSTGRGTFDWTNHFDHTFSRLTPFGDIGIGNTITDSRLFMRPYTTLGFNAHFQGGANFDLWKFFSVGGSAYDIVPSGQQTVFSKVVRGAGKGASHGRVFQQNQQTTGSADIAKDNGFSAWIDANPSSYLDLQLGYTRSVQYDLNSVSFTVGVDVGHLARSRARQ